MPDAPKSQPPFCPDLALTRCAPKNYEMPFLILDSFMLLLRRRERMRAAIVSSAGFRINHCVAAASFDHRTGATPLMPCSVFTTPQIKSFCVDILSPCWG